MNLKPPSNVTFDASAPGNYAGSASVAKSTSKDLHPLLHFVISLFELSFCTCDEYHCILVQLWI